MASFSASAAQLAREKAEGAAGGVLPRSPELSEQIYFDGPPLSSLRSAGRRLGEKGGPHIPQVICEKQRNKI